MLGFRRLGLLFSAGLILLCGCAEDKEPLTNVLAELDTLETRLEWVDYRLTEEQWQKDRSGVSDSLSFYNDLYLYLVSGSNLYKMTSNGDEIKDRADKQRLQILIAETLPEKIEARPALSDIKDSLANIESTFKVDFQGQEQTLAEIKDTYYNSRNRSQRELACRAWYSIGENLSAGMGRLIRKRNEAAIRLGFENYWELVSSQFAQNGVDLLQLIKAVDSLTQPGYEEFTNSARSATGVNQLELWDIPYTFSQIEQRGNTFFPADSAFTFARRGLRSVGFDLDKLPIYIDKISGISNEFEARTFAVKPPHDIRILTNGHDGFENMQTLLNQLGVALYSAFIAQERPIYNFAADTTWEMAMGEITATMAYDSAWLNDVVNMPLGFISQFRKEKLEQEIIQVRTLLANINFIYEAHINPERDLNQLYWDLYQKYTGLPRHEDIIIWSTIPELISDPMNSVRQLVSKAIAAQSVNYMTSYFGPLTNNHNTSSFLIQNYFRFGSRYSWSELIQRGTGEKLSPTYLKKFLES